MPYAPSAMIRLTRVRRAKFTAVSSVVSERRAVDGVSEIRNGLGSARPDTGGRHTLNSNEVKPILDRHIVARTFRGTAPGLVVNFRRGDVPVPEEVLDRSRVALVARREWDLPDTAS